MTDELLDIGRRLLAQGRSWFNTLHYRVDPLWGGDGGVPRYIGELDPSHRANLYSFLCRRAGRAADAMAFDMYCFEGGEHAEEAAQAAAEALMDEPLEHLLDTPFMLALGALLLGDGYRVVVECWAQGVDPRDLGIGPARPFEDVDPERELDWWEDMGGEGY